MTLDLKTISKMRANSRQPQNEDYLAIEDDFKYDDMMGSCGLFGYWFHRIDLCLLFCYFCVFCPSVCCE